MRTVAGATTLLVGRLQCASVDWHPRNRRDLMAVMAALQAHDSSALNVARVWQRRLSDLRGPTASPGEAAFFELREALDCVWNDRDQVVDRRRTASLVDVVDELLWSAHRVAQRQRLMVTEMIGDGRLFVPRGDVVPHDFRYFNRPLGSRPLQALWVRTNLAGPFKDLMEALAHCVAHLDVASDAARRLAGTSRQLRPGSAEARRHPAPVLEVSTGFANPGQELVDLGR
ncbi:hypothetical protein [Kribbella sp. NPDC055071]